MKKKGIGLVAALIAAACCALYVFGSSGSGSTLISRSYLDGTLLPEIQALISQKVSGAFEAVLSEGKASLESKGNQFMSQIPSDSVGDSGWSSASAMASQSAAKADLITISAGSGLIWHSGTAAVSGSLIDVTDGTNITSEKLIPNHYYLAREESEISVGTAAAYSVEGRWKLTPNGATNLPVERNFTDVPEGEWYYDAVYYAVDKGLFNGISATEFAPGANTTRAMLSTVLHRFQGSPTVAYTPVFSDVPDGTWYTNGTVWAGVNKIVNGIGDGTFRPENLLTRQQIAVMLYNYANWLGCDTAGRVSLGDSFTDGEVTAVWAYDAVSWAASTGILRGSEGLLRPDAYASRAELAIMLQRFEACLD